jgi:CTP synthase
MGIQPDILIARSEKPLDKRRTERLSLFCNLDERDVMTSYDVKSVYEIPVILDNQGLTERITTKLSLDPKKANLSEWSNFIEKVKNKKEKTVKIAIVGKYFSTGEYQLKDSYAALFDAIDHASWAHDLQPEVEWVDAEKIEKIGVEEVLGKLNIDGIIVPIGWGERGAEGMIAAATYAREKKIPYLGLCYGMQLAAVAYARSVLGIEKANTEENDKNGPDSVIHIIPSQKDIIARRAYGGTMRLGAWEALVKPGTYTDEIYSKYHGYVNEGEHLISERHRHRYEFNDAYAEQFESKGMTISARSKVEGLAELIELSKTDHPFYVGIQGHPEYKSRPLKPHPLFLEFIQACIQGR